MYTFQIKLYEIMIMTMTFLSKEIIKVTVSYLKDTKRFDESLI